MSDWFDAIPAGWTEARLKSVIASTQTGVWGSDPKNDSDDVLCVRVADFDRPKHRVGPVETLRSVPAKEQHERLLQPGDILLEKSGGTDRNPVGFTVLFEGQYPAVSSNFVTRLRLCKGHEPRFWLYALAASYSTGLTARSVRRTTGIQNLDSSTYFNEKYPCPPLARQVEIADYLDRETAQIDNLIAEQERLIELLRERRQAVIDSVIDSVEAPRGQLRRAITFLTSGSRGWGAYYADAGARFLRIGNLPRRSLALRGQVQRISLPEGVTEGERTKLQLHDLLFSITAYLGSVAVVDAAWAGGYVSQHVALCRMDSARLEPHFVGWSMLATNGQHQLNVGAAGGTKVQLALDDIRGLEVAYPSLEEQRRIVKLLDTRTAKIDQLIAEAELFIRLARERRSALITAAVTGQIEIPEAS